MLAASSASEELASTESANPFCLCFLWTAGDSCDDIVSVLIFCKCKQAKKENRQKYTQNSTIYVPFIIIIFLYLNNEIKYFKCCLEFRTIFTMLLLQFGLVTETI